ncbi:hypothetical protein [Winogradskyella sp. MH6]|uniref:hypothetical protein n=1 Tax=Winogradskyella sp. MH6 TaxID=2929510 RepID=UPI001FB4E46E|nr:hypothetical protein [Winogradskyella sp. MH6]
MEKNTLDDILKMVTKPAVFFYPRDIFEEASGKNLKELDTIGITNTLIVRNSKGDIKPLEHVHEALILLNKHEILDAIIFEVLKMSNSIDKESFLYFLNKYFQSLDTWLRITELTQNNAKHQASNYLSGIQSYLELQHKITLDHKTDLVKRFGEWKRVASKNLILKRPLPSFNEVNSKKENLVTTEPSDIIANKKTTKTKRATPSIEEVDKDLLQNIFNVELTTNNNTAPNS